MPTRTLSVTPTPTRPHVRSVAVPCLALLLCAAPARAADLATCGEVATHYAATAGCCNASSPEQSLSAALRPLARSSERAVVLSQEFHLADSTEFGDYSSLCASHPEVVANRDGMSGCVAHLDKRPLNGQDMEAAFLADHAWVPDWGVSAAYETKLSKSGKVYTRTFTYTSWEAFEADGMTGAFAYNTTNWAVDSLVGRWAQYNLQSWYYEVEAEHCAELTAFVAQARANWVSLAPAHMPFFYAADTWDRSYVFCRVAGSDHDTRYFAP